MKREKRRIFLISLAAASVISGVLAYLFYNRIFAAALIFAPVFIVTRREVGAGVKKKREGRIRKEFLTLLEILRDGLRTGYSFENCTQNAEKEMCGFYGKKSPVLKEVIEINRKVRLNIPIEEAFSDFAEHTDIREVRDFTDAVRTVKRTGGQLTAVVSHIAELLYEENMAEMQIESAIASKVLEQRIMTVMPVFILIYLRITSQSLLAAMYGSAAGIITMTACLFAYAGAYLWGQRIVDIRV